MARLVNVRLDDDRLRKVRRLRAKGVRLADVVRDAIDVRYDALAAPAAEDAAAIYRRILAEHPDPEDLPPRTYDVHDRKAARAAVTRRLRRPRSR